MLSDYLTLTNKQTDPDAPAFSTLEAKALPGPDNDTLILSFNEPVNALEAADVDNYEVENPTGGPLCLVGCKASYDPVNRLATLVLSCGGLANLKHGTLCTVSATGIHDLSGNAIEDGTAGEIESVVTGDGDLGSQDQPSLVLAYFIGDVIPDKEDRVRLVFNEEMTLSPDSSFGNEDIEFWDGGDHLGSAPLTASIVGDGKTVEIVLGPYPQFSPNFSRILTSIMNDSITDLAGNLPLRPTDPGKEDYVLLIYEDKCAPELDQLTLSDIPGPLNGFGPAKGSLLTPCTSFDITLDYHDVGGSGVDVDRIEIWNSRAVAFNNATIPAGADLAPYLTEVSAEKLGACYTVPMSMLFPTGDNVLFGNIRDRLGNPSETRSIPFEVTPATSQLRPFETNVNPSQVWNLLYTRDLYNLTACGGNKITVTADLTSNGIPDFEEDLLLFGLGCTDPGVIPGTAQTGNAFIRDQVIDRIEWELRERLFKGVNIVFTHDDYGSLPGNVPQVPYNQWGHSQIAIGGVSDLGALGCAFIDRNNASQDNDTLYNGSVPYNPGTHLGVFPGGIFMYEVNTWQQSFFRLTFDPFIPGRGTPVGEGMDDTDILMELAGVGPAVSGAAASRRDEIRAAVERLARSIAVVAAHEMGHSLGLAVEWSHAAWPLWGRSRAFPGIHREPHLSHRVTGAPLHSAGGECNDPRYELSMDELAGNQIQPAG